MKTFFFEKEIMRPGQAHGFTLVETLVAITILLIAVLAPMRIVSQSIKAAALSQQQLTATFLAQEGVEAMIRLRDDDALDGGATWDWYTNLPSACSSGTGCDYDPATDNLIVCSGNNCKIYLDESASNNTYYSHDSNGTETLYTRTTTVSEVQTGEVEVTCTVSWYSDIVRQDISVELQTTILDQYGS